MAGWVPTAERLREIGAGLDVKFSRISDVPTGVSASAADNATAINAILQLLIDASIMEEV